MGITCRPVGKLKGLFVKMEKQLERDKKEMKRKKVDTKK